VKNLIFLLIVAAIALAVLLFIYNPQVLEDVWLWIVGLIGTIIGFVKKGIEGLGNVFSKETTETTKVQKSKPAVPETPAIVKAEMPVVETKIQELESKIANNESLPSEDKEDEEFKGTTLTVLRYFDDGETTLGLFFIDDKFFSYTLEDTFQSTKVYGKTRIPKGIYKLDFNRNLTGLTETYRKTRPWFEYHIEIKDVENFSTVYIHSGSTHEHTKGCLLIADSIYASDEKKSIFNSKKTFERFYRKVGGLLNQEQEVRIKILDENWLEKINLQTLTTS
jgi:hypothetical protein